MKRLGLLLSCLTVLAPVAAADSLKPFSTDGCSDFPNGTPMQKTLWLDCCIAHDKAYWLGGSQEERFNADLELERCVAAVGEPAIASLMLAGVRVGGSPWWPTRFRWGYGWPWPRGYKTLTATERELSRQVQAASGSSSAGLLSDGTLSK